MILLFSYEKDSVAPVVLSEVQPVTLMLYAFPLNSFEQIISTFALHC